VPKYTDMGERIIAMSCLYYGDCWVWLGQTCGSNHTDNRYGRLTIRVKGKVVKRMAHRISYEFFKGPIPTGFEVDHKCYNTECVNPAHLEAVPPRVNYINRRVLRRA
jgi:hypothetical protein